MSAMMKRFKETVVNQEHESSDQLLAAFERLDYEQLALLELAMEVSHSSGWTEGYNRAKYRYKMV